MGDTAMLTRSPFANLICPTHRARLQQHAEGLSCPRCERIYPVHDGIPDFTGLPGGQRRRWKDAQQYELRFWRGESPPQQQQRTARFVEMAGGIEGHLRRLGLWANGGRVLQVGAATGGEINWLGAAEKYAIEPLACHFDKCGLLARGDVRWIAAMGEHLPFDDASFALVLLTNVLDHVAEPARLLGEIKRCLQPGGVLYLSCHVSPAMLLPGMRVMSRLRLGYFAGHLWFFSPRSLDRACAEAGLKVVDATTHGYQVGDDTCRGSLRRRLKPFVLKNRVIIATRPTASGR